MDDFISRLYADSCMLIGVWHDEPFCDVWCSVNVGWSVARLSVPVCCTSGLGDGLLACRPRHGAVEILVLIDMLMRPCESLGLIFVAFVGTFVQGEFRKSVS